MDDSDQPAKKQLKKLNLPPMDPLLKPGAGGKVGSGSDLEDGDDDDGDDDEEDAGPNAMQIDKPEGAADDDDEEDPLDAFMSTVSNEVKTVDAADRKRFGTKTSKIVAPVMGDDDGAVVEDPSTAEPDELDQAGAEDIMALAAKKIKKKDIPTVDHSKMDYEPFQKEFYHPPTEIRELSEEDADRLRMELDAIKVRGKDCPKPLTKWSYCGLPASCLDVIKKLEYASPTPIQAQAIPAIMSGRDMIGVAKTGSGKTMAFLLPMFRHIKDQRPVERNEGPIGLIMTPTRELAVQIYRESRPFLKATGLRAVCVYGGAPISEQIAEMKKTADIVVATPGRMIDLLTANSGRVTNLRRVTYLVLDEADRMFDMGFEPQVMKIINNIRPDRQTVLFSATFPKQMESLARKVLRNKPLEITVGGRSVVAPEIEQIIEVREEETKFNRLLEILGQTFNLDRETRALIFVDRQKAADELFKQLLSKGYTTMSLHGGQDQVDRDATISDFKAGEVDVVIATSIAARGLDIKQLKLVINYDAPNHMEDYVHRAGRTGRAGNKGTCVTFITPEQDRYARDIIAALKASKVAVPAELQALADAFQDKVTSGKAHVASSGFGGKGLERLESDREKNLKAQRSAYGEGEEGGGEAAKDGAAAVPKELDDIKVQRGPPPAEDDMSGVRDLHIEVKKGAAPESVRANKVKAEGESDKPAADSGGSTENANNKVIDAAKASGANAAQLAQALAKINAAHQARLNQRQQEAAEKGRKPKDPDATDYHAIVPINDFPQKARWRCTNKETMSTLIAETGASITNRGIFYEKGKEPQPGEPPKLQLLIESNDEGKVEHAVRSIKQILLEATQAALEAEQRNPPPGVGRYNVV
jgi:ATP-dependent RNA helicase DDX46/PRP5